MLTRIQSDGAALPLGSCFNMAIQAFWSMKGLPDTLACASAPMRASMPFQIALSLIVLRVGGGEQHHHQKQQQQQQGQHCHLRVGAVFLHITASLWLSNFTFSHSCYPRSVHSEKIRQPFPDTTVVAHSQTKRSYNFTRQLWVT